MLKRTLALSALAALLVTGCSDDKETGSKQAAPQEKQQKVKVGKAFAQRDTDSDGLISRKEFNSFEKARAEAQLATLDSNKDSAISNEEYNAYTAKMQARMKAKGMSAEQIAARIAKQYASLDKDGNGSVTAEEYIQRMMAVAARGFKQHDSDANAQLTPEEFHARKAAKTATGTDQQADDEEMSDEQDDESAPKE